MGLLDDRVVIVTGGGRGIGRSHCPEPARHGAKVVVDVAGGGLGGQEGDGPSPAEQVVEEIRTVGGEAVARMNPWSVDDRLRSRSRRTLDAAEIGGGQREAYGVSPWGAGA